MADELVPGVWRLHETRGCNVYLLRARDGRLVLVDTGFPSSAAGILRELTRLAPGEALAAILITHGHFDHAGAAGALRSTGTSVFAGRGDTRLLPDGRRVIAPQIGRTHLARRLLGRRMEGSLAIVDVALDGEVEVVPGIRAVPVPGHTPGSYCYIDEDRGIAFADKGDSERALADYEQALKLDPKYAPALLYKGQVLFEVKSDYAGAIKAWERFVSLTPPGEDRQRVAVLIEQARSKAPRR